YYEFYFFVEGNINIRVEGNAINLHPGDLLVIPPGARHFPEYLDSTTPYRRFVLWISADYCNSLMQASTDYGYLMQLVTTTHEYRFSNDVLAFNEIQSMLFNVTAEVKGNRFGKDAKVSLMINDLVLTLNRMIYERKTIGTSGSKERLSNIISDYIMLHLDEDLSLERLEKEFYVSKYHIEHVFKDDFGISMHKFIQMKRLYACRDAIGSGKPIQETFPLYGFNDYSVFFRAFKKEFGLSPKEYQMIQR
ncbi:MAG: helix-turn-helix transcriptional regulator, partial [Lachnospiraceae bacterium]|nr:helix-turn-helix transcriptional regulator [Lachnospiraceae bacterium]